MHYVFLINGFLNTAADNIIFIIYPIVTAGASIKNCNNLQKIASSEHFHFFNSFGYAYFKLLSAFKISWLLLNISFELTVANLVVLQYRETSQGS